MHDEGLSKYCTCTLNKNHINNNVIKLKVCESIYCSDMWSEMLLEHL